MQVLEKIQKLLAQNTAKKIVFYFDEDESLREVLPNIAAQNIKIVEVNNNYFFL